MRTLGWRGRFVGTDASLARTLDPCERSVGADAPFARKLLLISVDPCGRFVRVTALLISVRADEASARTKRPRVDSVHRGWAF